MKIRVIGLEDELRNIEQYMNTNFFVMSKSKKYPNRSSVEKRKYDEVLFRKQEKGVNKNGKRQ